MALGMVGEMSCCGSTDCLIKESNQHCYHYYHRQVGHYYLLIIIFFNLTINNSGGFVCGGFKECVPAGTSRKGFNDSRHGIPWLLWWDGHRQYHDGWW